MSRARRARRWPGRGQMITPPNAPVPQVSRNIPDPPIAAPRTEIFELGKPVSRELALSAARAADCAWAALDPTERGRLHAADPDVYLRRLIDAVAPVLTEAAREELLNDAAIGFAHLFEQLEGGH